MPRPVDRSITWTDIISFTRFKSKETVIKIVLDCYNMPKPFFLEVNIKIYGIKIRNSTIIKGTQDFRNGEYKNSRTHSVVENLGQIEL